MKEFNLIKAALKKLVIMHGARINFLACFIVGFLKTSTVNLKKVATGMPGAAHRDSKYKRIQRFLRDFELDLFMIAELIASLVLSELESWTLAMDRTNWKYGKINLNILTLGVAYQGSAIPLFWIPLRKRGNSNTSESISIVKAFLHIFPLRKIKCLTGDREFIGQAWFRYLLDKTIPFRMRIKENIMVTNSRGAPVPAKNFFRMLKPGEWKILDGRRTVCGVRLHVIGLRLPNSEYLILVTDSDPEGALDDYRERWEIETLFGCLKTRGFDFECTHVVEPERVQKLVALMAIAYCWCVATGKWMNSIKEIKTKKHGRKEISLFRHGLNELRDALLNISDRFDAFRELAARLFESADPDRKCLNKVDSKYSHFLSCT